MNRKTRTYIYLLWLLTLGAVVTSCSKDDDDGGSIPSDEERYTGDSYQDLHSPWVKDPSQKTHVTRWECILFGSYPTNEVVSGSFNAVDSYALVEGDVATPSGLCVLTAIRPVASLISATSATCIIKERQSLAMMPPCCLPLLST